MLAIKQKKTIQWTLIVNRQRKISHWKPWKCSLMRITLVNHTDLQQLLNFTLKCFSSTGGMFDAKDISSTQTLMYKFQKKLKHFKPSELLSQVQFQTDILWMRKWSLKVQKTMITIRAKNKKDMLKKVKIKMVRGRIQNNT